MEKESSNVIYVKCSKESIKRFIRLYLSINSTPYWFHQTLTFKDRMTDKGLAKRFLKKLLDSLEKAYPQMAGFFIQGNQRRIGIHYHIIFIFWGAQLSSPEEMRVSFGRDVFERWNKIHGGTLFRQANLMTLQRKEFRCIEYLLKNHVRPTQDKLCREPHWHGVRNKRLIRANPLPVTKQLVKETYHEIFPKLPKSALRPEPLPQYFTKQDLKKLKKSISNYCEITGSGTDWESYKRCELGIKKKVSDAAYMEFRNKKWNEMIAAREPKIKLDHDILF